MGDLEKTARAVEEGQSPSLLPASTLSDAATLVSTPYSAGNEEVTHEVARSIGHRVWVAVAAIVSSRHNKQQASFVDKDGAQGQSSTGEDVDARMDRPAVSGSVNDLIVRDLEEFPKGYANLAAFLDSDENFMLYRRFGYLQSRILLEKQDELRELEEQLDALDGNDTFNDLEKVFSRCKQGEDRKGLLMAIEAKFCEYARALSAAQQLMSFNRPANSEHRSAMAYIHNNHPVDPKESAFLRCKEDLITLRPGREYAWLDASIERILKTFRCRSFEYIFCSKESRRKSSDSDNIYYSKDRIAGCALGIIVLMILFLLIVPTYWLFHLVSEAPDELLSGPAISQCIGILLVFTLLFSAVLSLFTGAKRHEILGAAAAYCAVLVVFLGNVGTATK